MDRAAEETLNSLPARWSYSASVRRMKATVWKWKRITATMLRELWIAHEMLAHPGNRVANATRSWETYCEEIGLNRVTAWRWLQHYDPASGRLLEAPPKQTANVPARRLDPEARLLAEIRPQIEKMDLAHRLRVAALIVFRRG